jgi:uncharacterized surface protein with fasciclin (FAS1) repeats
MNRSRMRLAVGLATIITLFALVGCAAQEDPVEETDAVDVETTEETTLSAEATETPSGTTLEILVGREELEQFISVAQQAGVFEAMQGLGPYTVFAPSDDAWNALGEDEINRLLERENRDELARLVAFHVVPGRWTLEDLQNVDSVPTISGRFLPVGHDGADVQVGGVTIEEMSEETEDGVVYVMENVLDPETGTERPQSAETTRSP